MSGSLLGVVLAGGGSRRFGRPKGEARLGERTLVERAVRTLKPLCAPVLVGREPFLPDLRPGEGPLAGLEAALARARETGAPGVVVLACDLPAVHTATLVRVLEAWRSADAPERTIAIPEEPLQPLCGVWGVETEASVRGALDAGRRSAVEFLRAHRHVVGVPAAELADELGLHPDQLLHNVNTPDDVAPARELPLPPVISVVGWKDSGKTTVAAKLVAALVERGIDVAAVKHGHKFRLDHEGTDSWRLRHEAGARRVLLAGPDGMALLGGWSRREPGLGGLLRRHLRDAEVVVAEGWKAGPWPAVEVRAPGRDDPPLHRTGAPDADRFLAVVGALADGSPRDGAGGTGATRGSGSPPALDRDDAALGERLADLVEDRLLSVRG